MKKLQKLKLTAISKADLESKAMDVLRGGYNCSCSCSQSGSGGSSTADNRDANSAGGYGSGCSCACSYTGSDGSLTADNKNANSTGGYFF